LSGQFFRGQTHYFAQVGRRLRPCLGDDFLQNSLQLRAFDLLGKENFQASGFGQFVLG